MVNMNCRSMPPFDVVLLGGGLQSALVALCVLEQRPEARIAIVERDCRMGGNHTWSFHSGDVPEEARALIARLVTSQWPCYDVAFPGSARTIVESYASITSERLASVLDERLRAAPNAAFFGGAVGELIDGGAVLLDDGRTIEGRLIVDARGPGRAAFDRVAGYQKFVGLELALEKPHPRRHPMLMDARVPQADGFRFFYVLPFGERRVLVEDTYFSDRPDLDVAALRSGIVSHAASEGYAVSDVVREEVGVLPLPARCHPAPKAESPLLAGYGGGFFHPATGYSFPVALRLACHIANTHEGDIFGPAWQRLIDEHRSQFRFATLLNRMLFGAFVPECRWNALARFYRLPEDTIRRFYALETTPGDRLRLLCGRPPRGISIRAAMGVTP
jgi:lycopene beta-cyclase